MGCFSLKRCLILAGLIVTVFGVMFLTMPTYAKVEFPNGRYEEWSENNIVFYNPDADDSEPVDDCEYETGEVEGVDAADLVWNWLINNGLDGKPEAIAGVLGNIQTESGFNPFIRNGSGCLGIFQECDQKVGLKDYLVSKGIDPDSGSHTSEDVKNAIIAELEFAFINKGSQGYLSSLDKPTNKAGATGARAYADLFLVKYERAVYYDGCGSKCQELEDPGVKQLTSTRLYQGAASRRTNAENFFNQYKDKGGVTGGIQEGQCSDGGQPEFGDPTPGGSEGDADDLIAQYNALTSDQYAMYGITSSNCAGGWKSNCVSFTKWFASKFGGKGTISGVGNGRDAADRLAAMGFPRTNTPGPYTVFSVETGTTMCGDRLCGHTGVILAVTEDGKFITGEAGCSATVSGAYKKVRTMDYFVKGNAKFVTGFSVGGS
ncbi:MAG: phage tail tip lysozyme [Candidatus Saccharibacteria bacterium]|nr:phage tail tip lysozyme [Candidatus Saccharibacteria bacterium]